MTSIIEKRRCIHRELARRRKQNEGLKDELGHLQALANIGTSTSMIAHEINNLLTPLGGYAKLALNNPDDKVLTEKALQKTTKNCQRALKIMDSILKVAKGQRREKRDSLVVILVEEIFSCLCRDFSKDSILVEIQIPEDLKVWGVPIEIQQVLMNLILNGRDAMLGRGGVLCIRGKDCGDKVAIEISDSGAGIEAENLEKIFEPFFSTKGEAISSLQGRGLGLAFCKKVTESHKGSISVKSTPGEGTIFRLMLPKEPEV